MNCDLFVEKLPDVIENEVSGQDRQEMFEHMKYCKCCREEFQMMMKFRENLKDGLVDTDLNYVSKKASIIDSIDKSKYKKSKNKVIYKSIIGIIAASIVVFVGWSSINKIFFNKENSQAKNVNTVSASDARSFSADNNKPVLNKLEVVEAKKSDNTIKPQVRDVMVDDGIRDKIEKKGDSLLPLKDTIFKQGKQWAVPPRIEYMNNEVMIISVANFIGAYSFKEKAYYSIIDLSALDVAGSQGSQVYDVEYINNRTIAIGTVGEEEANNRPIYIIDLVNEKAIEIKELSLNNSKLKVDSIPDSITIAKSDFSKVITLNYKSGEFNEINESTALSYNYSTLELEKNEFIKKSIYSDKKLYPSVKSDDKLIALYKNRLFVQRGDSIYVIAKDMDKLLVGNIDKAKLINSCSCNEKIVIEEEKETIVINKETLEISKYKDDISKMGEVKYSPKGKYRVGYDDKILVQSIDGMNKEINEAKENMFESKITDDGKLIYLTLDEEVGVKVNIKDLK